MVFRRNRHASRDPMIVVVLGFATPRYDPTPMLQTGLTVIPLVSMNLDPGRCLQAVVRQEIGRALGRGCRLPWHSIAWCRRIVRGTGQSSHSGYLLSLRHMVSCLGEYREMYQMRRHWDAY